MFCGHCGAKVSADAKFCPSCGAPIRTPVHAQPQPAPAYTAPAPATAPGGVLSGSSGIVFLKLLGFGVLFWAAQNLAYALLASRTSAYGIIAHQLYYYFRLVSWITSGITTIAAILFTACIHRYCIHAHYKFAQCLFRIMLLTVSLFPCTSTLLLVVSSPNPFLEQELNSLFTLFFFPFAISSYFSNLFLCKNLMIVRENHPWHAVIFSLLDALLSVISCFALANSYGLFGFSYSTFSHIILFLVTLWYFTLRKKTQLRLFGSPRHI